MGGIHPARTLPIVLDAGTSNRQLLEDPEYIGWRHERITGDAYLDFVDRFVQAAGQELPGTLLQWEDFATAHARPILDRYRDRLLTFNDDIQGTAAVVAGTLAGNGLALETSLSGSADLGPLQATIDRLGLVTTIAVQQGNLGPLDISFAFKPPTGVGLSIDAAVVSGGGFLYIDTARGQYAGVLQLTIADFLDVMAIGLIETKMPDGSNGLRWSNGTVL